MPAPPQYYQTPGHVVAAAIVLSVIDITAVILRFWARKKHKQALRADDWLMVVATLLTLGICILIVYGVSQQSLGYPLLPENFDGDPMRVSNDRTLVMEKIEFAFILMLPLTLGCIKLGVLWFYLRIFTIAATSITYKLLLGLCVLVGMWTIGFFFANLFECNLDMWALWGTTQDLISHCPRTMYYDLALCITDFVTDVIILAIPIIPIWRLHLSIAKRIAATAVFLLGIVAIIASLLRLVWQANLINGGFDPNIDEILAITGFLYWGMVECGTAIFAACLPVLQVLIRDLSWKDRKSKKLRERQGAIDIYDTSEPSSLSAFKEQTT